MGAEQHRNSVIPQAPDLGQHGCLIGEIEVGLTPLELLDRMAALVPPPRIHRHRYEGFPLVCPLCGADMRIIAFIVDTAIVRDIRAHLGEPTAPPRIAPLWAAAGAVDDPSASPRA